MKFVLATSGTHGDLHPYLGAAIELKARGHDVTLATCASYRAKVEAEGLRFHAVRPDLAELMKSPEIAARGNDLETGTEYILKELVLPKSRETYDDLSAACQGADLFVTHQVLFPSPLVAERLQIPWISVILSPGIFLSAYDPPLLPPIAWFHGLRKLGPAPHRLLRVWIDRVTRQWMRPIEELRRELRLPPSPKNPIRDGMLSPFGTLGWFSPALGEAQPDWPANTQVTGFIFFDKTVPTASDSALRDFLDAGEPPVVFTLGTSAVTVARDFYRTSLDAVRKSGLRAVLLVGSDPRNRIPPQELGQSVFAAQYAPYSALFPRAAAVVHSGGIGTIAQTLRAAVPSIVVPHSADQPDNAHRLRRTGAGLTIRSRDYTSARVAGMLGEILQDPRYSVRAREIGERIRGENGLTMACDALERYARERHAGLMKAGQVSHDPWD